MLNIGGKEVGLRFSVRAKINISKICPGSNFSKISECVNVNTNPEAEQNIIKILRVLNAEYERNLAYERGEPLDPGKDYCVFDEEDVYNMPYDEMILVIEEMTAVINGDSETTIETKQEKKRAKTNK